MIPLVTVLSFVVSFNQNQYFILDNKDDIVLSNRQTRLNIEKKDGTMTLFITLTNKSHTSTFTLAAIHENISGRPQNISINDTSPYYGELSYRVIYAEEPYIFRIGIDSLALYWKLEMLSNKNDNREREMRFYITNNDGFEYSLLCDGQVKNIPINRPKTYEYRNAYSIPTINLSNRQEKIGISIIANPELYKPSLQFALTKNVLTIVFRYLNSWKGKTMESGIFIIPNQGDWRPGLDYLLKKFPGYFDPVADKSRINEGWFYLGSPFENENKMIELKNRSVNWIELHNYFPFYGMYTTSQNSWGIITDSDMTPLSTWEKGSGNTRSSYLRVVSQIDLWHKYGIKTYLYFQPFEAWHQYSEKYFASDIAKDRSGNNIPGWQYCTLMNPDPASDWGKHIIEQANRIVEKYPTIDGIFYDRMDYCYYDYAHDDGITVIEGKPAYMLGFALEKMNDTIFKIFHNQGKAVWGNGPTSLEVCKNLDGIMAEGSLANLYKTQYLGLTRPIVYLPYDKTPDETEEKLKNCLLCGAFPSVTYGDSTCQKLDEKYRPLFEILKGRTWVLTPNPLMVPDKYRSNIFRTRDGDYAVVVISPDKSQLYNSFDYNIPMTVNLSDVKDITNVYLLSGDWTGIYEIKFKKHENLIEFLIPGHISNSLILLTRGKRYQISRFFDNRIWTLDDITLTPPKDIFIQSRGYETLSIDVTNNTGRKQVLRITALANNNNGEIQILGTLTLGKYETKSIIARIKTDRDAKFSVNAQNDHQLFSREFSVKIGLTPEPRDLFHDDFPQGMDRWTINRGTWHVNGNVAEGSGPSHFAFILNDRWVNYQYQVATRIKGSDDPEVDWLKSYLFFRVRDDRNFYRFGIHGDGGVVDLFKCVNGEWIQLGFVNFMPKPDKWYTLMVEVTGSRITGFVDGKKVMETQDAEFSSGGVGFGVLEDAMRSEYKEIIVKKLD